MKVLFSAHDAGGANAIAPVIAALGDMGAELHGVLSDPAQDIFAASRIPFTAGPSASADIFVAGTSAGDTPDKRIMREIGETPSLYVLDFWLNYWQRFSTTGGKDSALLPTRICVMDDIAKKEMIAEGFPSERLTVTGNPHFDHFADAVTGDSEEKQRILFLSQPLRSSAAFPFDEFSVLSDMASSLKTLPEEYYISIRLHPKEERGKFDAYLSPRVRLAEEATLEDAMSASGLIVGMISPTLIQAAAAGKRVVSYEPGLVGADSLVSNRCGVTRRLDTPAGLAAELGDYAAGKPAPAAEDFRKFWPSGATERVVEEVLALIAKK
jgi:hypothetical protein